MYNAAQRVLGKGLSPFSRIMLGLVSGLFGVVMLIIAPGMSKPLAIYAFGAFCIVIALMCIFTGKVRNYLGRVIGAIVFLISVFFFVNEVMDGKFISFRKSEPSVLNAVFFFFAFGFPGIWFAIKGKFPFKPD